MNSYPSQPSHQSLQSSDAPSENRAERIETLLAQIEQLPDARVRAQMEELLSSLLDLFGDGLARMLELTESAPAGNTLLAAFAGDELVGSLLMLYGLHPDDLETRLSRAVDGMRPDMRAYGTSVELLRVVEGVAYVRLDASGKGCSSPLSTLQPQVEQALYAAAPELEGVRVETPSAAPKLITLTPARRKSTSANGHNGANGGHGAAHEGDQL